MSKPTLNIINNELYHISPKLAPFAKVIGVGGNSSANGAPIVVYDYDGLPNQYWRAQDRGASLWSFVPQHATDKRFDTNNGVGNDCHIWDTANPTNVNQMFYLQPTGDNIYFGLLRSNDLAAVECKDGSTVNGTPLVTAPAFHFNPFLDKQLFRFLVAGEFEALREREMMERKHGSPLVNGGVFHIIPGNATNKVLGVGGDHAENGSRLVLWDRDGRPNQHWRAEDRGNGLWSFVPLHALDKRLDSNNGVGQPCHIWDTVDPSNQNQLWRLQPADHGRFLLLRASDGAALDVANSASNNGAELHTWADVTRQPNQQFAFERVA